jgi:hypothetical protein
MQLGDLLTRLQRQADAAEALGALGDLALFARVSEAGRAHGETPGEYVAFGAARFANRAGHEDWLALVGVMERAGDPGRAALLHLVQWALAADAREAASACGNPGSHACGCAS